MVTITVYFIPDPEPSSYQNSNGLFDIHGEAYNKGLALFRIDSDGERWGFHKVPERPKFKVAVDFTKTVEVRSIDYPFIRNRTELSQSVREKVVEIVNAHLDKIQNDIYGNRRDDFIKMLESAQEVNGIKIMIPFKDQAEHDQALQLIMDNPDMVDELSKIYQAFNTIIRKIGGMNIPLAQQEWRRG